MDRSDLRAYQHRAIAWQSKHRQSALFLDMGLGKTIVTLTTISDLLAVDELTGPVLLIGPIRVIKTVWRQEAAKWEHTRHLRFALVHGSERERLKALATPADIYLTNPENTKWIVEWIAANDIQFGMLVVDESSKYKDVKTGRFKALRNIVGGIRWRTILTGTPTPNNLMEVWPQVFLTDSGKRLGSSFYRFRDRFFETTDYMGYDFAPRPGAESYIYRLLEDLVIRLDAKDWLTLPPIITNVVRVDLPEAAWGLYKKMENDMLVRLAGGEEVEAVNAAVASMKCHQIANGAIYADEERTSWEEVHDAKLDALAEILDEAGGPMLVAYNFRHDLERLKKAYPKAPVLTEAKDPDALIAEWNQGKHPVMFIHPQSGGHGLNLQEGGCRLTFFSLTWSLEQHDQVIARIGPARQVGRTDRVIIHYIVASGTVDEAILRALSTKTKGQKALLDILRAQTFTAEELLA